MNRALLSEIRNRAIAAQNADALEMQPMTALREEARAATLAEIPTVDPELEPIAAARAEAAALVATKAISRDSRTAIITASQSVIRFVERGPADVLAMLAYIEELESRLMVLEAHTATLEQVVLQHDALKESL